MLLRWEHSSIILSCIFLMPWIGFIGGLPNPDSTVVVPSDASNGDERSDVQQSNTSVPYLDNDYAYLLSSLSENKGKNTPSDGQDTSSIANGDDGRATSRDCKQLTIPNGVIKGDIYYGPDSLPAAEYSCNDGYMDNGNGLTRCNAFDWHPPPNFLCRKLCPQLKALTFVGSMDTSLSMEPVVDSSMMVKPLYSAGTSLRFRFQCRSPDLRPQHKETFLECGEDGDWKLLNDHGQLVQAVQTLDDLCTPAISEVQPSACKHLHVPSGLNIRYKSARGDTRMVSVGDEVIITCSQPNYIIQSHAPGRQSIYQCMPNGRWSNEEEINSLNCVPGGCPNPVSDVQLRPVFEQQESARFARQSFSDSPSSSVQHGIRVFYTCTDPEHYYLIGDREYVCNNNGTWTPPYWPRCERKKKCTANDFPTDGYYNGFDGTGGFEPGHVLSFGCADGFRLDGHADIKCLQSGDWNFRPPTCVKDEWSTKRFIAVSSVACLLGVMLVAVLGFFLQRQLLLRKALSAGRRHRLLDSNVSDSRLRLPSTNSGGSLGIRSHHQHPQLLTSAARTGPAAFDSDPDRLALIAFADGVQMPLPTYEEAVSQAISERRCHPPPFDAISTLSGYCSRAVRRLPSLSSLRSTTDSNGLTHSPRGPSAAVTGRGSGQRRSRFRNHWSSASGSNVSSNSHGQRNHHIGSNDTVGISDASTNVTLETVSTGGQSHSASAQAYAGSLSSVHSSNGGVGGASTPSVPAIALSMCSTTSVTSSFDIGSGCSVAAVNGSESEGLPLLESQEDVNEGNYEVSCPNDGHNSGQDIVDSSDEICSQKSLDP